MRQLIVVSRLEDWPLDIAGVEKVTARDYLTEADWSTLKSARVFNLCRSYRYQANGYYVSLLAAARGHKPLPAINTIQDLKSQNVIRVSSGELGRLIEASLKPLQSDQFVLSIYFGRNLAKRYERLSRALFNLFSAPLLKAEFQRLSDGWVLRRLGTPAFSEIPAGHLEFLRESAELYFSGKRPRRRIRKATRFDVAMLVNPDESDPPSDERALKRFEQAGEELDLNIERIGPDEIGRLPEFDALFIRETTAVNHHTFRFARRAAAEGLVVIDDPDSILKCTNKVYLAELLQRNQIAAPKTLLVHRDNADRIEVELGLPVVLKQPDSAFSIGVVKVHDAAALKQTVTDLLKHSDLVVAQEYLPTAFDWRVGLIDGRPLYVCRYHMARGHWQIIHREGEKKSEGGADTISVGEAPPAVIQTAVKAASLIGNGLYGVDLKEVDGKVLVIEVNDNPSIDGGVEDAVLKNALYREILGVILQRVTRRKLGLG
ncbi:MAG: ATP-grasp domain-containing protein [Wenzhouxiangella sp.]|nr:MAG: ATP-grasp domain-containing protein [Wenzhouxiangella sp.]